MAKVEMTKTVYERENCGDDVCFHQNDPWVIAIHGNIQWVTLNMATEVREHGNDAIVLL